MLHKLKRHPIAMQALLEEIGVLTYAINPDAAARLLPNSVDAELFRGRAFAAIATVRAKGMRPVGTPTWMGQDVSMAGVRVFVRTRNARGTELRGLWILRSLADRRTVTIPGNILTHYNYGLAKFDWITQEDRLGIELHTATGEQLAAEFHRHARGYLPTGSIFRNADEALRYAGPLPWTVDHETETDNLILIKGVRKAWAPELVRATVNENLLAACGQEHAGAELAAAFRIRNIPYHWNRGIIVTPKEAAS